MKTFERLHKDMIAAAKAELIAGLYKCTEDQRHLFIEMYKIHIMPCGVLDETIENVVAGLPDGKLEWAMKQVDNTLIKNNKRLRDAAKQATS